MEWKLFFTVLGTVFIAEMADKTQIATLLFAADRDVSKLTVFLAASLALIATSAIGVAAGAVLSQYLNVKLMSYVAGTAFIVIGAWTLWQGWHSV